jgi:hypothetical protein
LQVEGAKNRNIISNEVAWSLADLEAEVRLWN